LNNNNGEKLANCPAAAAEQAASPRDDMSSDEEDDAPPSAEELAAAGSSKSKSLALRFQKKMLAMSVKSKSAAKTLNLIGDQEGMCAASCIFERGGGRVGSSLKKPRHGV
jgi:hypothetical protein